MSNFDDQNDPSYVVPENDEPVAEYVVREPEPIRRVAPAPVEVEPTRHSLRWLWWLLGLLVLAGLIWLLLRNCNRAEACTSVPESVFTTAAQTAAVAELDGWMPGIAADHTPAAVTALRNLCNMRLGHTGAGNWYDNDAIQGAFSAFEPNLEPNVITNVQNLVNGNTFCRCQ